MTQSAIREIREALEFYANPDSWRYENVDKDTQKAAVNDDVGDIARKALTALAALEARGKWRPVGVEAMNGNDILGYWEKSAVMNVCSFEFGICIDGDGNQIIAPPTHFQPLPEAPGEETE